MNSKSRLVLERFGLVLLVGAWMGCTQPSTSNGNSNGTGGKTGGNATGGNATGGNATGGNSTGGTTGGNNTGGTTGGNNTGGTTGGNNTGGTTGGNATGGVSGGSTGGTTGGGTGGTTVVQKLCATKTKPGTPVFMDFENYNGMVIPTSYVTAFGGTTVNTGTSYAGLDAPFGDGTATPTASFMAGHPPSNWAISESVTQASGWGMGDGIWTQCLDASAYKGITLWVRGSSGPGTFSLSLSTEDTTLPATDNPAGGGTCTGTSDTCKGPSKSDIPLTTDWAQVSILWSDFTPGVNGSLSVVPDGSNITGATWSVPLSYQADPTKPADAGVYVPVPGDLRIDIDDITFIQ